MPVSKYPNNSGGLIQPTKAQIADLIQSNGVSGTYYTLLNVISGKGILSRLSMFANGVTNNYLYFKITVDGGTSIVINPPNSSMRALAQKSSGILGNLLLDFVSNIYFNSSIKIEVMQNTGSNQTIEASADYSLI